MGWAKFVEDNMEMWEERFYRPLNEDRYQKEAVVQVCAILPLVSPTIEVKVTVNPAKSTCKQDRQIICKDCGNEFVFSGGEQAYFEIKGYSPPKRCKKCREIRKAWNLAYGMRR